MIEPGWEMDISFRESNGTVWSHAIYKVLKYRKISDGEWLIEAESEGTRATLVVDIPGVTR